MYTVAHKLYSFKVLNDYTKFSGQSAMESQT